MKNQEVQQRPLNQQPQRKNPAAAAKPAATTNEAVEEKRREPRPQKVILFSVLDHQHSFSSFSQTRSEKPIEDPEWQKLPADEKVQHKVSDIDSP